MRTSSIFLLSRKFWAWLTAISVAAFAGGVLIYAANVWPGDSWAAATPAELGLDSEKLGQARDYEVIFERVFTPLGIHASDIRWRNHQYRPHDINGAKRREFGSGIHANVQAMARIGYLYLREGRWAGEQILPPAFIQAVRHPDPALAKLPTRRPEDYGRASQHYSMLW